MLLTIARQFIFKSFYHSAVGPELQNYFKFQIIRILNEKSPCNSTLTQLLQASLTP